MPQLGPDKAYIFRITHIRNVPFILDHGIHCRSGGIHDPEFIAIGLPGIINRRAVHPVPIAPGGTLADYVPFYFTPWSIMLLNIKSGKNPEVIKRESEEIVIMVSSLPRLTELGRGFIFTNGHAALAESEYFSAMSDLGRIDWTILRNRDFKRDPDNDPGKIGRYQAEALVHRHVPVEALLGIVCYDQASADALTREVEQRELDLQVKALPDWYF